MTEILTESFCERCGTRYTFESAAPRKTRMGRMRTASKGLRNYVLQDESSFSEAMADARSEEERNATSHQLDAFHKTFNFCMTCRQYTCGNCWNTAEGRCLTCSPVPGSELPPIVLAEAVAANGAVAERPDEAWPEVDVRPTESWPEADLDPDRLARAMGIAAADDIAEDGIAADDAALALRGVAPGQSLEDALAAYEAQVAAEEEAEIEAIEAVAAEDALLEAEADEADEVDVVTAEVDEVTADAAETEADETIDVAADAAAVDAAPDAEVEALAEAPADELDEDRPLAAAAALGAAAVVLADDEPEIAAATAPPEVEAEHDHGIAKTIAAGAFAAAAWPVDDDEPLVSHQPAAHEPVAAVPEPEPEPVAAVAEPVAAAAEPVIEPEPEPVVEPETIAAAAVAAAAADAVRDDVVVQPTWPVDGPPVAAPAAAAPEAPVAPPPAPAPEPEPVAPVVPPAPAPAPEPVVSPWLTVAPDDGAQPQWPAAPQWAQTTRPTGPMTLAGRQLMPRDDAADLWAASAREVLSGGPSASPVATAAPTIAAPQPCVSCGLSLSANARFCRRCGTRQG
jgi:hypothetical protein